MFLITKPKTKERPNNQKHLAYETAFDAMNSSLSVLKDLRERRQSEVDQSVVEALTLDMGKAIQVAQAALGVERAAMKEKVSYEKRSQSLGNSGEERGSKCFPLRPTKTEWGRLLPYVRGS